MCADQVILSALMAKLNLEQKDNFEPILQMFCIAAKARFTEATIWSTTLKVTTEMHLQTHFEKSLWSFQISLWLCKRVDSGLQFRVVSGKLFYVDPVACRVCGLAQGDDAGTCSIRMA